MQLKLGDVLRIEIKNHDFVAKNIAGVIYAWWHVIIGHSHFGGLKSLEKLLFFSMFLLIAPAGLDVIFFKNYFLENCSSNNYA